MWFLIVKWWYTLSFTDAHDELHSPWDAVTTRGGWSLILAKRFGGRIIIWKEKRETFIGLLRDGIVYQPDTQPIKRNHLTDTVKCIVSLDGKSDTLYASKRKCQYYINKVR